MKPSFSKGFFVVFVGSLLFPLLSNLQNTGTHPTLVPTYLHSMNCSSITYILGGHTMFGERREFSFILVLFILLVVISCACDR
ncbi:sporulation protein YjcZ [Aneurinibacillus tyrosinisolvens]|uniref:sporulation protein YjcZ n=1 Tax=Aneurinibacillus tyrosinisolvens TaxID=1443435 RepID=UPI0034E2F108